MTIEIKFRGLEGSEALREYAVRRIHFQLSRFGRELSAVSIRLGDVNGPKGGVDKRCQVMVRGPRFGTSMLEEASSDAYAAIDIALERAARTVGRHIERARERSQGGADRHAS